MQNSIYKIEYLLFLSWDWEAWCLSQLTSSPISLVASTEKSAFSFTVCILPPSILTPWA